MFASAVLLSTLVSSVFANLYIINPVASTNYPGGTTGNIAWEDDGTSPSLSDWKNASVGIYTGNRNEQTLMQMVDSSVNVADVSSINFVVNANLGPNDDHYFIRIQSLSLNSGSSPEMSFSALFTLSSMTGKYNASVSSEVAGESTAPVGASSTAGSNGGATVATTPTSGAGITVSTDAASSSSNSNGAMSSSVVNVWGAGLAAALLALML